MRHLVSWLIRKFMDQRIFVKIVLGYVIIILSPTILLVLWENHENLIALKNQSILMEKSSFHSAISNFTINLNQIDAVGNTFQSNKALIRYASKEGDSISSQVYSFQNDISPLIAYIRIINPFIYDLKIYSKNQKTGLYPMQEDLKLQSPFVAKLKKSGLYEINLTSGDLFFYCPIYNQNFTDVVAVLRLKINVTLLLKPLYDLKGETYVQFEADQPFLKVSDDSPIWSKATNTEIANCLNTNDYLTAVIAEKSVYYKPRNKLVPNGTFRVIILLIPLLAILSFLYYIVLNSVTKRVVQLQKHMQQSIPKHLEKFQVKNYSDEIGKMIISYNTMIDEINDLIHKVYETELNNKNVELYALQNQIQPHFIFNMLENIKVIAMKNRDNETANIILKVGEFMRYNYTKNKETNYLIDELQHAKNYLDLFKIRLNNKLHVEITSFTDLNGYICPRFVLQPLLENCFKHGLNPIQSRTFNITIMIKENKKWNEENLENRDQSAGVLISVQDNGRGISSKRLKELQKRLKYFEDIPTHTIGLCNVNNRLVRICGKQSALKLDSRENVGTIVSFSLFKEQSK